VKLGCGGIFRAQADQPRLPALSVTRTRRGSLAGVVSESAHRGNPANSPLAEAPKRAAPAAPDSAGSHVGFETFPVERRTAPRAGR
jgi:hypothetical protein